MSFPPQITDSEWLETVSPTTLREGKMLAETTTEVAWNAPVFKGKVIDGARHFLVSLEDRKSVV